MSRSASHATPRWGATHLTPVATSPTADRREPVPSAAPLPDLMKPSDVAIRLGVTAGRVYQLIAAGTLPSIRRGRSVRVPRQAYERWLATLADEAEATVRR